MERLFTLREAADKLSVSREFLKRAYRAGRLRIVRLGRAVRVPAQEVERVVREGLRK